MPNFIEMEETFCGRTDGRTYARTDGRTFETGFIRSTVWKNRPKKVWKTKKQRLAVAYPHGGQGGHVPRFKAGGQPCKSLPTF